MGFSFLALALIQSALPDMPWRRLVDSFGYSVGFVIVVLGRQELFTESTLTAVLPLLVRRDRTTLLALLRCWALVLSANIVGTFNFAGLLSIPGLFSKEQSRALSEIAIETVSGPFWPTLVKAFFAGWLIALMAWLLPSAKSARLFVILLLTYVVAIGRFSHIIAGGSRPFWEIFNSFHRRLNSEHAVQLHRWSWSKILPFARPIQDGIRETPRNELFVILCLACLMP